MDVKSTPDELGAEFSVTFRWLQRTFRARGLPAEEASDLAQETITRTFIHLRRHGQTQDELGPLMNRIAKNLLIGRVRSRRPANASVEELESVFDPQQDPENEVLHREQRREMLEAISGLPTKQRRVVLMSLDGLAPQEMASRLKMQRGAIDVLLHRARRTLASRLTDSRLSGALIIIGARLRSGARRVADRVWMTQQMLSVGSQLGVGLVSVAIVAVLSGVQAHVDTARPTGVHAPAGAATYSTGDRASPVRLGTNGGAPAAHDASKPARPVAAADVRGQHARLTTPVINPVTGSRGTVGAEVWVQHTTNDGKVGPLLNRGSADACTTATRTCKAASSLGGH